MKLTFIGVSSAFAVGKNIFQSNMLLESTDGRRLLIDCGSDARHALHPIFRSKFMNKIPSMVCPGSLV
jgi:ribonuclease BN (tRNA processing enzyme)